MPHIRGGLSGKSLMSKCLSDMIRAVGRRSEEGVQRILLRYDGAGQIERLTWERFTKSQ